MTDLGFADSVDVEDFAEGVAAAVVELEFVEPYVDWPRLLDSRSGMQVVTSLIKMEIRCHTISGLIQTRFHVRG